MSPILDPMFLLALLIVLAMFMLVFSLIGVLIYIVMKNLFRRK